MDKIKVGSFVECKKKFSLEDVKLFAELSNDKNPIHLNAEFAAATQFGKPMVHGIFVASIFSSLIANELPGPGSIYLHQSLDFVAPVFHDMEVTCRVEVLSLRTDKPVFEISTTCQDNNGKLLITGKAVVLKK